MLYKNPGICVECGNFTSGLKYKKCRRCANSFRARKYQFNFHFFDNIDSEEKAYWLGFISADGHLTEDNRLIIDLQTQDIFHLQKLIYSLKGNMPIHHYEYPRASYVRLQIQHRQIGENLKRYGLNVPKNITLLLEYIPSKLFNHFLRGFFDGDGCFSFNKNPIYYNFTLVADKNTLIKIQNLLVKILKIKKIKIFKIKNKNCFKLAYGGHIKVKKILDWLYKDAHIFLYRKYLKYKTAFHKKRFFINVVEECIQNPKYFGYRGGRLELYDEKSNTGYAIYEGRFLIPEELIEKFRECFDFVEVDKLPYLRFDMEELENKK